MNDSIVYINDLESRDSRWTRRRWLVTGLAAGGTILSHATQAIFGAEPILHDVRPFDTRVISWKPPLYHGWPTLTRRKNGELLLVFSGGREDHVCPFGRLELMRSRDEGKTWGWPQVLYDGPIDDRDAGILETQQGSLLVTNFTSLAYESLLQQAESRGPTDRNAWTEIKLSEWHAAHHRLSAEDRQRELGCWMLRSTDGGVTWSARYRVPVNSPHGPIPLRDGRVLYCGISLWDASRKVGAAVSEDDGVTWKWLSDLPVRPGDDPNEYHELHAVECKNGQLICHIRNDNVNNGQETLQSESTDGGKTWSVPHSIGVWGLPSHLLALDDHRLLMTYGHRRPPFGIQARVSHDHGRSWNPPLLISGDGVSGDLGYPSTVQVSDHSLVTIWYERMADSPLAQLRQARWRLP